MNPIPIPRVRRWRTLIGLTSILLLASCGGDDGAGAVGGTGGSASANAPTLLFAASTGTTSLTMRWDGAASGTRYDVYAGTTADFQPSAQTLRATVQDATTATLTGLQPGTSYTLKLVAHHTGAADAAGTNALTVATMDAPLVLRSGVVIERDSDLGVSATAVDANTLTLAASTGATPPPIGSFLTGQIDGAAYLRKVTALEASGSGWIATTQDVRFQDLYASGKVSYTLAAAPQALQPVNAPVTAALKPRAFAASGAAPITCEADASASVSVMPSVVSANVSPQFSATTGFDANAYPYFDASASAAWAVDLKLDAKWDGAVSASCDKELLESKPIGYAFTVDLVPFEVGATFSLHAGSSVASTGTIDMSIEGISTGTLAANLHANHDDGLVVTTGSTPPPTLDVKPILNSDVTGNFTATVDLDATLLADGYLSIGSRQLHLDETVQVVEVGVSAGPEAQLVIDKTKGFVQNIKPFQLTRADLDLVVTGSVKPGTDLLDFLSALGIDGDAFELTPELARVPAYHMPTLALAIDSTQHATGSEVGGVNLKVDPGTIIWAWKPAAPPPTNPMVPTGNFAIDIQQNAEGCTAISATDKVFGEFGRRYSDPQPYGVALINFSATPSSVTAGDVANDYVYGKYDVGAGTRSGGYFKSFNDGGLNQAFMVYIRRTDGQPFTLKSIDMGTGVPRTTSILSGSASVISGGLLEATSPAIGHFDFGSQITDVSNVTFLSPYIAGESLDSAFLLLNNIEVGLGCGA